jgi:hypothetical protein
MSCQGKPTVYGSLQPVHLLVPKTIKNMRPPVPAFPLEVVGPGFSVYPNHRIARTMLSRLLLRVKSLRWIGLS